MVYVQNADPPHAEALHIHRRTFPDDGVLAGIRIIFALTKGGPGNTLMNISLTSYLTAFTYQRLAKAMPYLLVLWLVVNFVAKWLVDRQRKYAKEAAGL
jgi:ABC-type sugar transport system permease subunit